MAGRIAGQADYLQSGLDAIGGFQSGASEATSRAVARSTDASVPNVDTFRDINGLESVRNSQQNSLASSMDWMQQQNWNRDKEAYVLQNATQNWMKDQDQARASDMMSDQFNIMNQGKNLQQGQIDSDAAYARQRQLMQDQAQINFNQTGRPSTTSVIGGGGAGGGSGGGGSFGGGGSGGASSFDWLANEEDNALKGRALDIQQSQVDQQTRLGYDQNDANRFAAVQQKDAAMLASFLNASISRR